MKKGGKGTSGADLRLRAEEQLAVRGSRDKTEVSADLRRAIHELEVHQIELEMQNEELRETRHLVEVGLQRYTELFDFAPIGYVVLGADTTIRNANLASARMLGLERSRLVGRHLLDFVAPDQRARFSLFLEHVLGNDGDPQRSETCELTLRGSGTEPVESRLIAAMLAGAESTVLVAIKDVTARKHAEAALRDEARRKDEFLAVLSHELRNPLSPIRSSLFVLERTEPGGDQARNAMAIIDRQVTQLTRIVEDLLDVTRIARGKVRLQRERIELGDLVRHAIDDHRHIFEACALTLEGRLGSELLWVDADRTRLVQVVGNLLGNAVKFTPGGGRVEVGLRRHGDRAVLSVRDNGMGIAEEMRARLFQPFSQAPQHLERTRGGLGLGLAMVRGLVELHGGTVDVASGGPDQGTEFTVRLPLATAPAKVTPVVRGPAPRRRHRVLLIEDSVDAADSLRDVLVSEGQDVQVAYDGLTGLRLAQDFLPEIVFCDIGLPGMDGYRVARAIRDDKALKGVYLVALSGYALPEDRDHALKAGFDRHVAKPLDPDQLERVMTEAPSGEDHVHY